LLGTVDGEFVEIGELCDSRIGRRDRA